jgi:purine-binding chemotaxis protein CheW
MTEEVLARAEVAQEATDDSLSDTQQFVTFRVGGEVFAVDMAPVQEIIRVPDIVRVPLAPHSLQGMANLRGRVLPIISLRCIFGFEEQAHDDATRAVVIDLGQPLGFVVDRVASVINVEPGQIEGVEGIRGSLDSELLTGVLKEVGGFAVVMVLDFAKLIAKEFAEIAALTKNNDIGAAVAQREDSDAEGNSDELQLVSFTIDGQEYAIDIARVQEIVQVPETIVHVPNSPAHMLGLMTLRERLLPLVSLRSLFGLPVRETDERSRIVVVALDAAAIGVVTDSVSEVLRVPKDIVDVLPPLLARGDDMGDISHICRLEGGKRLVSIISADHMFRHSAVKDALRTGAAMREDKQNERRNVEDADDEEQVVVFRLAEGEFGVPLDSVQEIVRVPEKLNHVPKTPPFVEGVINLRGTVLPVIDQRKRLGLPDIERNDRQRIMVFLLDGVRTGFIVDTVTEVLKIPKAAIEPSPRLSDEQAKLLGRVANLEKQKRMIQLINPAHLVDETGLSQLAAIND